MRDGRREVVDGALDGPLGIADAISVELATRVNNSFTQADGASDRRMSNRKSLLFSALCMSTLCVDGRVCAPLAELDATRYIGRWYQVYYNDLMKIFSNPDCSSALYGLMPNASLPTITVNNSGLSKGKDEKPISYIGYAVQKNPTEAGEFTLTLQGVPTKASYRICDVGEPTYLGKYHQYSAHMMRARNAPR